MLSGWFFFSLHRAPFGSAYTYRSQTRTVHSALHPCNLDRYCSRKDFCSPLSLLSVRAFEQRSVALPFRLSFFHISLSYPSVFLLFFYSFCLTREHYCDYGTKVIH
ncbi:hypothetical protein BCV70DRAFT_60508 [Testicularia cyperi]|uniref:Uncharacterized protein n=1 Tax=Testicularia cyperi TaxID=1882483 RepID=A0A317XWQ4_9BASI|nr:hypothetical protein BCV70DRAFT_60508 [Testicularia cyperi]